MNDKTNVVHLFSVTDIPTSLRAIADDYERGHIKKSDNCTVVLGWEVFSIGSIDDEQAARDAVFYLSYGAHKLLGYAVNHILREEGEIE